MIVRYADFDVRIAALGACPHTEHFTTFYDQALDFTGLLQYSWSMNSERTQMARKTTSAPMRWIVDNFYFSAFDSILHFGEGKAFQDTELLKNNGSLVYAYDPNSPHSHKRDASIIYPGFHQYDVGVSVYVFNTLEPVARKQALQDMLGCCRHCLVAVRTDKVNGEQRLGMDGVITKRNTFQTQLDADAWVEWFTRMSPEKTSVKVLHKTSGYVILGINK